MRRKYYEEFIEDIALDISQSNQWREQLKNSAVNTPFLVEKNSGIPLPYYLIPIIDKYDLKVYVSKVEECEETFDEGLIIFKFSAYEYPDIVRFTGNNFGNIRL